MYFIDPDGMQAVGTDGYGRDLSSAAVDFFYFGVGDNKRTPGLYIDGEAADKATNQLQDSVSGLTVTRDAKTSRVDATVNPGANISGGSPEDYLLKITKGIGNVIVNLHATNQNIYNNTILVGGMFMGNKKKGGITTASQVVNPDQMDVIDSYTKRGSGVGTLHEVLEAYVGGLYKPNAKPSIEGITNLDYDFAHNLARQIDSRHKIDYQTKKIHGSRGSGYHRIAIYLQGHGNDSPLFDILVDQIQFKKLNRK